MAGFPLGEVCHSRAAPASCQETWPDIQLWLGDLQAGNLLETAASVFLQQLRSSQSRFQPWHRMLQSLVPQISVPHAQGGQKTFLAGQVSTQPLCKQQAGPLGKDQKPCGKKISIKDELGVNSSGSSLPAEVRSWRQARLGRRMDANAI